MRGEKGDGRRLRPAALGHIHRQAFLLCKQGYTWQYIAEVRDVDVGNVLRWAQRAQTDSLDTVIKAGRCGRHHVAGLYFGQESNANERAAG